VGIFAIAKFTEGAWLVVVVFPLLVFVLIRLNREYRTEAAILERFRTARPEIVKYARHRVFVLVNSVDLAVIEALRYGRGLRADDLTAVHFMIDATVAAQLKKRWEHFNIETPLRIVDCPDRRVTRAAQELVARARAEYRNTNVTVLLPRRSYAPLLGRLLHDRTADKIARAVSRVPDAAATIVPYDVQSRIREAFPDLIGERIIRQVEKVQAQIARGDQQHVEAVEHPGHPPTAIAVDALLPGHTATVEGRVQQVDDVHKDRQMVRAVIVGDDSGDLRVTFPSGHGSDILPGQLLRITGRARKTGSRQLYMSDPEYHIIAAPDETASS